MVRREVLTSRYEILPFARAIEEAERLSEPSTITVTCSPKHGPDQGLEVAAKVRGFGHTVVLHIAARMVRDAVHREELLTGMAQAGIEDLFLIGGDAPEPVGAYDSAGALLPEIVASPNRPRTIGIGAYPEGHPLISDADLWQALESKAAAADYMVTQMCFDARTILAWLQQVRARGITLPALIGLPGEVDAKRLLEISSKIGVGPSLRFARKQSGLRHLLRSRSTAERLLAALARASEDPDLGIEGIHMYTFNRLLDTWKWVADREQQHAVTATAVPLARESHE